METIESFPPRTRRGHPGRQKYPWDKWADGQIRVAVRGEDFELRPLYFSRQVHRAAQMRGMKAKTSCVDDRVTFQFLRPEEPKDA